MQQRWSPAVWLGKSATSGEHILWPLDGQGVTMSRTIRLLDETTRPETIRGLTARPNEHSARQGPHQEARDIPAQVDGADNEPGRQHRKWQITRELFQEVGATPDCPKCTDWIANRRSNRKHTAACRTRLDRLLRAHPVFGPRVRASEQRARPRNPAPLPPRV